MKLMYFTDPHLKGRNPARRLDDYPSEVLMFFEEAKQIAVKEALDAVLIGGDIFDTPKISQRLYNKLARSLKGFPCPVIAVPGNHDIFGMNADNLEDTMLASLEASDLIQLVSEDRGAVPLVDTQGNEVLIHGKEFTSERDHGDIEADYAVPNHELGTQWNFLLTHAMLLDKPFHPDIPHTLIKDVAPRTNVDVIFGAHYHPGWDIIDENDITFIHPGSTARLEGTKREATRTIQYAYLEIDAQGELSYELRPFTVARKGADILDITTNVANKQHKNVLEVFRKQVDDAAQFESQEPDKILLGIAKANAIPKEISDMSILAILNAAKEEGDLNVGLQGFTESAGNIFIEWIELENFQAHSKTRFDFDGRGLNAIIGASDSGKTAAIRGLRWLLYNDPKGTDFIRFGASKAIVRARFSNGVTLERSRTQSASGSYVITDANGVKQEYKGFAHNVPIEVTNAHQMPKIQLSKDVESSLNIAYQLDGPFLIGESPSTRASVIGRLTGVHVVDAAIRETGKKVSNAQRDIKSDLRREEELVERLANEFHDIPVLEDEVNQVELLLSRAEKTEKILNELVLTEKEYTSATATIQQATQELVRLNSFLPQFQKTLLEADAKQAAHTGLVQLADEYEGATKEVDTITEKLKSYRGLKRIGSDIEKADELVKQLSEVQQLANELAKVDKDIAKYDAKLAKTTQLPEQELEMAEKAIQKLSALEAIEEEMLENKVHIQLMTIRVGESVANIKTYHEEYKALLKEMGKCPTCFTPIDDTIIDKITW